MPQKLGIVAPLGRDAAVIAKILSAANLETAICPDLTAACSSLSQATLGALIIADEALKEPHLGILEQWLSDQPPWSDLPIVLLTRARGRHEAVRPEAETLGNVTRLERPFHPITIVSAAKAALRARKRQHEAEKFIVDLATQRRSLEVSETRYQQLFEAIDEGFCVIEFIDGPEGPLTDYIHVEANSAYERHAGIPNVVGRNLRSMVPDEADEWVKLYRNVLLTGESIRFERELVATGRHLELAAFRVGDASKRQVAVLFQDQTARKNAERRLRDLNDTLEHRVAEEIAGKKLFAELVEGTDMFVQVADTEFRWLAVNQAAADEFERIYGVRPEVGMSMLDALADKPEHRQAVKEIWSRALQGEEFTQVEEFGDPGLTRRAYEIKFNVLRNATGKPIGAYQFVQDVSQRLADQEKLAEATAQVHEMAKLETLGQLTGGVAHDFNNLLTPIVGTLDILSRRANDERATKLISGAVQSAERATTLVQRLLTFARRQHLEDRPVDIGRLILGMRDLIQRSLGPQIRVEMNVPIEVAPARVDPNQLELAVLNLAVNARDAMPDGGNLTISIREVDLPNEELGDDGELDGRYVEISVRDTGAGMDSETLKRAIEPFFTTKGVGKGTGLGLSMVHGLAAQSGGGLRVISNPGAGTEAKLLLPTTEEEVEVAATSEEKSLQPMRSVSILLVDDEKLVQSATADMLRSMGHHVLTASSPNEALAILRSDTNLEIIISDYLMPKMRGSDLIAEAQKMRPDIKALLITGYSNLSEGEAADVPRLAKPFREAQLGKELEKMLA